jgi:hypothetical protein
MKVMKEQQLMEDKSRRKERESEGAHYSMWKETQRDMKSLMPCTSLTPRSI